MDREQIISYAYRYRGEYFRMARAISAGEQIAVDTIKENCLVIGDPDYPQEFYHLQEPPFVLFYRGDLSLLQREKAAVIGSRNAVRYSLCATEGLCRHRLQNKVIVSGLAKGIDACAHRHAARSIGVLGCGIDVCYPPDNRELIQQMCRYQLVLSEYPLDVKPFSWHFPFRNRLIAALGKEMYVMQSSIRSGTMTSVREALKLGRDVYALPFSLNERAGEGNNLLLSEGAFFIAAEDTGLGVYHCINE